MSSRKRGEVYTKIDVVKYILDQVEFSSNSNLENVRILEPASGSGAFALEILRRLSESSKKFGFNFIDALYKNVVFVEKCKNAFNLLRENISHEINILGYENLNEELSFLVNDDYLFSVKSDKFDCIVGNPPYIRHEYLDDTYKILLKENYKTFKYRADIYIPFFEKALDMLTENGKLSFICSNRWLYNQYGQILRKKIAREFQLVKLLNVEKSSPFEEEVIGYPCISVISRRSEDFTLYFETYSREVIWEDIVFNKVLTPKNGEWQNIFLNYDINHQSLKNISEQGFNIGIGVATGADKVYLRKDVELLDIEESRVIPIIKSGSLKGDCISWDNTYVLNPFESGKLCDLNKYPNFRKYLLANKDILINRHIAKKNPTNWFKTIDKINPELINKPKLLLPDLAGCKYLFIDEGNFYPHHNLYYIVSESIEDLKILACILMSNFIKDQLSKIGIRMNGGLPRFQSQSLRKLRVPEIKALDKCLRLKLVEAYDSKNIEFINSAIDKYCNKYSVL